ncbi:hypothetical protein NLJ89_g8732 [Agrocybe chaxingu]|uniref:TPX2 C-terminal domain-containing protein n=1 Tax=Agrocybe chaxingu TaxID=84603 RepID=A0A9W8JUN4_9AGAR|nr:hypothetical protein NLJ89_g8732 [Agrocybe chaxingu]
MGPANSLRDKGKGLTTSASSSSTSTLGAKPVFGEHATAAFDATKLAGSEGPSKAAAHERHEQETAEFQASKSQSRSQSHSRSRTRSQTVSQSQSQSQSHSRSTSSQSQSEKRYQFYHPVPDFKAIHATQEAELARLKENIHPTVPLPMVLETDVRAEERRKFDEKLKEKERELERLEEERRRQRELEEEREVRELRKRAVPKAHEVPEWYNEMPKRKNRAQ